MISKILLLAGLMMAFSSAALALRCGDKLISEGDTKLRVMHFCGKPDYINPEVASDNGNQAWMYNHGSHRFTTLIRFRNGVVRNIERQGYGF